MDLKPLKKNSTTHLVLQVSIRHWSQKLDDLHIPMLINDVTCQNMLKYCIGKQTMLIIVEQFLLFTKMKSSINHITG